MSDTVPQSLLFIATRVERRLEEFLQTEEHRWSDFDEDLLQPVTEIRRLTLSGGKRLRPAFSHWGFVGAGGDADDPCIIDTGAALELLHGFALFHDDIMDGATSRRGVPVTHEVFAAEHRKRGSAGEDRRYGEGVAILVGDLAFVYSDRLIAGINDRARRIWDEMRIELNIGQILDLMGSARQERRPIKTERICRYKSGKYTVERPLHLGALIAAPERASELLPLLSDYGLPLGDAFQMRDDVMGAVGDAAITGKPVGDDIREGKPTPLLALTCARATSDQMELLGRVGRVVLGDDEVREVQNIMRATGALDAMEETIDGLVNEAIAALDRLPFSSAVKDELVSMAHYVSARTL
ncbi:MAG: polyprenyl synthetase family protein [Ilumatobacteraceae bacterium]